MADIEDMLSRSSLERPVGEPKIIADLRSAVAYIVATNSAGRLQNDSSLQILPAEFCTASQSQFRINDYIVLLESMETFTLWEFPKEISI